MKQRDVLGSLMRMYPVVWQPKSVAISNIGSDGLPCKLVYISAFA
jgi:hypothetical protein